MWRWLRISLLGLCGLIAIAAGFEHWRSYRISSVGHWYEEKSWLGIYCSRGRIVIGIGRERIDAVVKHDYYERPVKAQSHEVEFDETFHGGKWLGVGYYQSNSRRAGYLLVPIWLVWGLAALPVAVRFLNLARYKWRSRKNLCVNCGFDVRGQPEKCPECGKKVGRSDAFLAYPN